MRSAPIIDGAVQAVGVICFGPAMKEYSRNVDGEARWCFHCRKRRVFERVVSVPAEPSYYGPSIYIECAVCHTNDGDCFPGRYRVWVDPEW